MRRFVFILIFGLMGFTLTANTDSSKENRKKIEIVRSTQSSDIMRDLSQIYAYLNLSTGFVEVEYYGINNLEIYIMDSEYNIVQNEGSSPGSTSIYLTIPETSGIYTIIISSSEFYGEGYFVI